MRFCAQNLQILTVALKSQESGLRSSVNLLEEEEVSGKLYHLWISKLGRSLNFSLQSAEKEYKSTRKPLHNFTLPRKELNWGSQYLVKFVKERETKRVEKPWNLRGNEASSSGIKGLSYDMTTVPRMKRRSDKSGEKARFSLSLSNEEIEYDFVILFRKKPEKIPKRMRKDKDAQRMLDKLVPGLCLT